MDYTLDRDPETGIAIVRVTGTASRAALVDLLRRLFADPGYDPSPGAIFDTRAADYGDVWTQDMEAAAAEVAAVDRRLGPRVIALLVRGTAEFGMWRAFQTLRDGSAARYGVFTSFEEAAAYILAARRGSAWPPAP